MARGGKRHAAALFFGFTNLETRSVIMEVRPDRIITEAKIELLDGLVDVHEEAFPGFFLTEVGRGFLREYYRTLVQFNGARLYSVTVSRQLRGFVGGYMSSTMFCGELRRRWLRFVVPLAFGICRRPVLLARVAARMFNVLQGRTGDEPSDGSLGCWELSSVAVRKSDRSAGLGRLLVEHFLGEASRENAAGVKLYTDAVGNDGVNIFYERIGFQRIATIGSRRKMNVYRYLF